MDEDNPFTKSQTIDPEVRAYVYSLVNALGGTSSDDDGRYVLGDDAVAVLRDLKRWLKLYDEKTNRLDVARCLAEANIVLGDLLPILSMWKEEKKSDKLRSRAALAILELLVPLTWPLEQDEMTVNHHRHTPYIQQAQVKYKAAILHWESTKVLRQVVRIALPSIAMRRDERTARDDGIIKLMLYFVRNVAAIRQIPNLPSQGLDNEVSRSATIETFRTQDVFALLLTMCSNMGEDFNLQDVVILEILFNLIKGVNVEKLWMTESQRIGQEVSDLKETLNAEEGLHRDAKKKEWSRHGRFGTMIWMKRENEKMSAVSGQDNLKDSKTVLFNMDNSKKWNKPQQRRKDMDHTMHDFDRTEHLNASATEKLRNFVEEFLDSGFNPLYTHLRRAIEREAERLLPINYRQFFYTVAWFLQAERVRRARQRKEQSSLAKTFEPESYSLIAAVLNQETFITLNRYMQMSMDEKAWQDLNACMRCFTQILLTVQDMAQSPLEEDQEIAENIQNRIFYEETTHDRVRSIVVGYKDQGLGYLDACTELSYVFLKMLERYSIENVDLQVRSKRKARRKQKEAKQQQNQNQNQNENGENDEDEASENEDLVDAVQVSKERKFDFNRFAAKFVSQNAVNSYVALTQFYRDLSLEQLKRAHRFFYRVAFKQEMAVLLYRVDIIALFYKMIEGPEGLSRKHPMHAEWSEFCKQLLRKLFKKLDQRPELMVEMLFSKINNTLYYLEYGHEKQTLSSTKAPAELEIRPAPGRGRHEEIGIIVTILIKDDKAPLVKWVKDIVTKAFEERQAWEAEAEARRTSADADAAHEGDDSVAEMPSAVPSYISIRPTSDEIQTAMFKNARLKLLMKLVGWEILGLEDALGATWIIPSGLSSEHLEQSKSAIALFEATPWKADNDNDVPEDMLRRVRKESIRNLDDEDEEARRDNFIDDSEGNEDIEDFMFPDNVRAKPNKNKDALEALKAKRRQKRKRDNDDSENGDEIDDELAAERRRRREENALARRRKIKSELYIRDSDDESDAEKDAEFFQQEAEVRKRQDERIRKQMALEKHESAKEQGKKAKKSIVVDRPADSEEEDVAMSNAIDHDESAEDTAPSSQPQLGNDSDAQSEAEETPISSPVGSSDEQPLKEISQTRVNTMRNSKIVGTDSDEEEVWESPPITQRRVRGGFVVDDDDDE